MSGSPDNYKPIKIFIGSPGDLHAERKLFREVLEEVNQRCAHSKGIHLEPLGWEDASPGVGRPQGLINKDLIKSDLVVLLLWKRWGTNTEKYSSGFEEEYHVAIENNKQIWLYFRDVPDVMLSDPGEQLTKVIEFRKMIEKQKKLLYQRYEDENEWKEKLTDHLCKSLDDLLAWSSGKTGSETFPQEILKQLEDSKHRKVDYVKRIEDLEKQLGESTNKYEKKAIQLVIEAEKHANKGELTEAETKFALATELSSDADIFNRYGHFLRRIGSLNKAEVNYLKVMDIGKSNSDIINISKAYNNIGIISIARSDIDKAEEMFKNSLSIEHKLSSKKGIATAYGNLGLVYKIRGDMDKAEEMFKKSLSIYEELKFEEGMTNQYNNLGNVFITRGDIDNGEEMFNKSLSIDTKLASEEGLAADFNNLGNVFLTRGELNKAEEFFNNAFYIFQRLGHKKGMASYYGNLGNIYKNRGDLDKAEEMFKNSLSINIELGYKEAEAGDYSNIGNIYKNRGDLDKAEEMYMKALSIAIEIGYLECIALVNGNLGIIYKNRGNWEKAESYIKESNRLFVELGAKNSITKTECMLKEIKKIKGIS